MERKLDTNLCCARCAKPIMGETTKIGRYTYGPCCIEIVKARKEGK